MNGVEHNTMISHRLETYTFLSPHGFTVEGICGCGFKIRQLPTFKHAEAVQTLGAIHDEHVIQVLERSWIGVAVKGY